MTADVSAQLFAALSELDPPASSEDIADALRVTSALSDHPPWTSLSEQRDRSMLAFTNAFALSRNMRPRRQRLDPDGQVCLTVAIDESPSMAAWATVVEDFLSLLARLGIIDLLRTWPFDSDSQPAGSEPHAGQAAAMRRLLAGLVDSGSGDPILVISDCAGAGWGTGAIARWLETWSQTAPVAVLQPMPARLWDRCRCDFTPVSFAASDRGLATARLGVTERDPEHGSARAGLAVPVLEMNPQGTWIDLWARLVAGSVATIPGMALYTGEVKGKTARAQQSAPSALERVRRFRSKASPAAYLLAGYLAAAAPLSLPVMQFVQKAMLPRSQPAHLAEILLSDLVFKPPEAGHHQFPPRFEFHDGVRNLLLAGLQRAETLGVVDQVVARFAGLRSDAGHNLGAILEALADGRLSVSLPFADVLPTVLRAVGGTYAELADKLEYRLTVSRPVADGDPPAVPSEIPTGDEPPQDTWSDDVSLPSDFYEPPGRGPENPAGWRTVPARTPSFIGREELLLRLRSELTNSVIALVPQALYGLGGVGKTQLAIQYATQFRSEYDLIWWIPAEHHNQILASLGELAELMNLPISDSQEQTARAVLNALRDHTGYARWLLIFDNAGPPDTVRPYVPSGAGHIIITSLNQEWLEAARGIPIDVFSRQESKDLLMHYRPDIDDADADRIARRLGDLPLAVEQAAIRLGRGGLTANEYLDELDTYQRQMLDRLRSLHHPEPVVNVWGAAFERLAEEDEPAARLLRLCAFFGPAPISTRILLEGGTVPELPDELRDVIKDNYRLREAILKIGSYGLASASVTDELRIHRLVQAVLRDLATQEEHEANRRYAHLILVAANPSNPDDKSNWPMLRLISAHVVRSTGLMESDDASVRKVVLDQMRYLYVRGDYGSSRILAAKAREIWQDKYPEAEIGASFYLGNASRQLGFFREALEINEAALARLQSTSVEDPGLRLRLTNSYGADLRINGDYRRALELDRVNVENYATGYGAEDRITLRCENNLAVDYRLQGDFKQALDYDDKILAVRTRFFGTEDQDTMFAECMRARDLRGCGRYRESLELHRSVLDRYRQLLGDSHQDVLNARLSYSVTLCRMGFFDESRSEAEDCQWAFDQQFGEAHPGTIMASTILASPLRLLSHVRLARAEAAKAYEQARRLFGADHLFTALYGHNLAITYRANGDYKDALAMDKQSMDGIERVLGPRHQFVLSSLASIASSYRGCDDLESAVTYSRQAYNLSVEVRGPDNPLTLLCAANLRLDLAANGQNGEILAMAATALGKLADVLGHDNQLLRMLQEGKRYEFDIQPPQV